MADFSERELRDAMGCFATGVTVVTTMTDRGPLGMTVSSFASVSLARKSARFAAFEAASHFAVHVLCEDQQSLAEIFANSGMEAFDDLEYTLGIGDVPLLDGCSARFECSHSAGHDGGDHLIVVGEVLRILAGDKRSLLFYRGGFSGIG